MDVIKDTLSSLPDSAGRNGAERREQIALTLKTLGHPIRIGIMELLHEHEQLSVGDICNMLQLEQSLTSHHLKNMRLNGILQCQRKGKQVFYFLSTDQLMRVINFLKGLA